MRTMDTTCAGPSRCWALPPSSVLRFPRQVLDLPRECTMLPAQWTQLVSAQAASTPSPIGGVWDLNQMRFEVKQPLVEEGCAQMPTAHHWLDNLRRMLGRALLQSNTKLTARQLLKRVGRPKSVSLLLDNQLLHPDTQLARLRNASSIKLTRFSLAYHKELSDLILIRNNNFYRLRPSKAPQKYGGSLSWNASSAFLSLHSRSRIMISVLRHLSQRFRLPDVLFQFGLGDVPLVGMGSVPTLTIHGWQKHSIPIPRWTYNSPVDQQLAMVIDAEASDGNPPNTGALAWETKLPTLIWRGAEFHSLMPCDPIRDGRTKILELAAQHPSLIAIPNISVPYYPAWAQHKYVICIDGVGPSFRLQFLMQLNSVIFLPDQILPNWLTSVMQPYVHYVPVARDLSNLVERILWARKHDAHARTIAANAFMLMRHRMNSSLRECAALSALHAIANMQREHEIRVGGGAAGQQSDAASEVSSRGACQLCSSADALPDHHLFRRPMQR